MCSAPACGELQPCPQHERRPWSGSDRRSSLPADWPKRRNQVFKRDGRLCQLRFPGCTSAATEVHHLAGAEDHRLEVLAAACSWCHKQVTGDQAARARRGGGGGGAPR